LARRLHWRKAGASATVAKRRVQLVLLILLVLLGAVLATGVVAAFSLYRSAETSGTSHDVFPLRQATERHRAPGGQTEERRESGANMLTADRQSLTPYFTGPSGDREGPRADRGAVGPHPEVAGLLPKLRSEIGASAPTTSG